MAQKEKDLVAIVDDLQQACAASQDRTNKLISQRAAEEVKRTDACAELERAGSRAELDQALDRKLEATKSLAVIDAALPKERASWQDLDAQLRVAQEALLASQRKAAAAKLTAKLLALYGVVLEAIATYESTCTVWRETAAEPGFRDELLRGSDGHVLPSAAGVRAAHEHLGFLFAEASNGRSLIKEFERGIAPLLPENHPVRLEAERAAAARNAIDHAANVVHPPMFA